MARERGGLKRLDGQNGIWPEREAAWKD